MSNFTVNEVRIILGLSVTEFAQVLRVTPKTIQRWVSGESAVPAATLKKLNDNVEQYACALALSSADSLNPRADILRRFFLLVESLKP